jgi:hypothetical protein
MEKLKEKYIKLHRQLWNWLAENPGKYKRDWPEWVRNGGMHEKVSGHCFACAWDDLFDNGDENTSCDNCLFNWEITEVCVESGSYYKEWERLTSIQLTTKGAKQRVKELSLSIMNLPVKEG